MIVILDMLTLLSCHSFFTFFFAVKSLLIPTVIKLFETNLSREIEERLKIIHKLPEFEVSHYGKVFVIEKSK